MKNEKVVRLFSWSCQRGWSCTTNRINGKFTLTGGGGGGGFGPPSLMDLSNDSLIFFSSMLLISEIPFNDVYNFRTASL